MRLILGILLHVLLIGPLGCRAERTGDTKTPPAQASSTAAKVKAPEVSEPGPAADGDIVWGKQVAWRSWESALSVAQSSGQSICVVVYADWCGRCKELAPVFDLPAVASAAEGLLMVRQDQDERPAWLKEQLAAYGSYVPRVLFLGPDGRVREDLQSGHPRYPHFYGPLITERLVANMRAASAR